MSKDRPINETGGGKPKRLTTEATETAQRTQRTQRKLKDSPHHSPVSAGDAGVAEKVERTPETDGEWSGRCQARLPGMACYAPTKPLVVKGGRQAVPARHAVRLEGNHCGIIRAEHFRRGLRIYALERRTLADGGVRGIEWRQRQERPEEAKALDRAGQRHRGAGCGDW